MNRDETLNLVTDALDGFNAFDRWATPDHPAHWIAGIIEAHCIKTGERIPTVESWREKDHPPPF